MKIERKELTSLISGLNKIDFEAEKKAFKDLQEFNRIV